MSSVDLNSGFHTCVENTLPREPSPQPRAILMAVLGQWFQSLSCVAISGAALERRVGT